MASMAIAHWDLLTKVSKTKANRKNSNTSDIGQIKQSLK